MNHADRRGPAQPGPSESRRDFLVQVSALGVAAAASSRSSSAAQDTQPAAEQLPNLLPTIPIGPHRITRLILGGNPIYGYSHFNRLYDQHLRDYHTPERVVQLVRAAVDAGINSWQNSYADRTVADVQRCRDAGIPFHWFLLGKPDWVQQPQTIDQAARHKPIGIAPHGSSCERLYRAGQLSVLQDMLKRIRQTGVLVGMSVHNPEVIRIAEQEGWDVDYYMCCLYYLTRPRDEFQKLLGEAPLGEIYLPSDRGRALEIVRSASKPCLAYKVLAAGRADLSASGVREAFRVALTGIKPGDAMIVGMFQEFSDQVGTNAQLVRQLCADLPSTDPASVEATTGS